METLTVAYVIAWGAVFAYVAGIVIQNRRLSRRLDEIQRLRDAGNKDTYSRAA